MKKNLQNISIVFISIIILMFFFRGKITHEKFNSEKWKNTNRNLEENWSIRWDMMNSLRNENKLIGKSYEEIIEVLGLPENEINNELIYSLGYSGNGINTGNLTIKLDQNKKVKNLKVSEG